MAVGSSSDAATVAAYAREALAPSPPQNEVFLSATGLAVLPLIWCDRLEETEDFLDRLAEQSPWRDSVPVRTLLAMGRCEAACRTGRLQVALEAGRRWFDLVSGTRGNPMTPLAVAGVRDNPALLPWRSLAALAHVALGRRRRVRRPCRRSMQ